jgi:hypothetical protein
MGALREKSGLAFENSSVSLTAKYTKNPDSYREQRTQRDSSELLCISQTLC